MGRAKRADSQQSFFYGRALVAEYIFSYLQGFFQVNSGIIGGFFLPHRFAAARRSDLRMLCLRIAISSARLARYWPFISEKSPVVCNSVLRLLAGQWVILG